MIDYNGASLSLMTVLLLVQFISVAIGKKVSIPLRLFTNC